VAYFTKGRPIISITRTEARTLSSLERLSIILPMASNRTPADSKYRTPGRHMGLRLVLSRRAMAGRSSSDAIRPDLDQMLVLPGAERTASSTA
jgi:hypothetical protein